MTTISPCIQPLDANSTQQRSPLTISPKEWEEIAALQTVIDGWGLHDWEPAERGHLLRDSVYGVRFDFTSGCPGYSGDLYILIGDSHEEPMMLLRDGSDGKLIAYCPSLGTRDDEPLHTRRRISLGSEEARRFCGTLRRTRDSFDLMHSEILDAKLDVGDVIDRLNKGYLPDGPDAPHVQDMVVDLQDAVKRLDAIWNELQDRDREIGYAVEVLTLHGAAIASSRSLDGDGHAAR